MSRQFAGPGQQHHSRCQVWHHPLAAAIRLTRDQSTSGPGTANNTASTHGHRRGPQHITTSALLESPGTNRSPAVSGMIREDASACSHAGLRRALSRTGQCQKQATLQFANPRAMMMIVLFPSAPWYPQLEPPPCLCVPDAGAHQCPASPCCPQPHHSPVLPGTRPAR